MKSEKEIRKEMMRCKKERDKYEQTALETGVIPKEFERYNVRYWALRWVLNLDGVAGDGSMESETD